jgi:hypothetical protein
MSPLLPIAGTAALSLAGETVGAIGDGFAFATELLRQDQAAAAIPPAIELPPSDSEQKLEKALLDFAKRLKERLAAAGVDAAGLLELVSDGLGGIQVGSETADRSAIEQVLSDDPQLLAEFNALSQGHESLRGKDDRFADFGVLLGEEDAEIVWR